MLEQVQKLLFKLISVFLGKLKLRFRISSSLSISYNDVLDDLSAFSGVSAIGWNLTISNNDALTSLSGFDAFTDIGRDLTIKNNGVLTDVTALHDVTDVARHFTVEDNVTLTTTAAEALRDAIGESNIGGTVTISGNDG